MKKKEYDELKERYDILEKELRTICNLIMKIKRQAEKKGMWISAGSNPYVDQTDEAQQGPMITKLYEMVDKSRKIVRKV